MRSSKIDCIQFGFRDELCKIALFPALGMVGKAVGALGTAGALADGASSGLSGLIDTTDHEKNVKDLTDWQRQGNKLTRDEAGQLKKSREAMASPLYKPMRMLGQVQTVKGAFDKIRGTRPAVGAPPAGGGMSFGASQPVGQVAN